MQRKSVLTLTCSLLCCIFIAACSSRGGYYKNDGPPSGGALLSNSLKMTPNAVPKYEVPHKFANNPYTVNGKKYYPITGDQPLVQTGYGSWYGKMFHGKKTSTGETYNMYAMTAAHKTMELPSYAKVTNLENGKSVVVRVNDRGPFVDNRIIDLSYAAASKLGYVNKGTARLKVERIRMSDIRSGRFPSTFSKVNLAETTASRISDIQAIASVLNEKNTQKNQPSQIHENAPSQTHQVDLNGAVNLTEVAQQTMVSTAVDLTYSTQQSNEKWCLQAGAFSSQSNAENFAQQIKQKTELSVKIWFDGNFFKVLLGSFPSKEEALSASTKYQDTFDKRLVPLKTP